MTNTRVILLLVFILVFLIGLVCFFLRDYLIRLRAKISLALMKMVVDKLISNAVKYSHPNSQVYITFDCQKKTWTLEVKTQEDEGSTVQIITPFKEAEVQDVSVEPQNNDSMPQSEPIPANELDDTFIKKAAEVVRDHISNPDFGKDEFAKAMFVSPSVLYKRIKTFTGQSPVDFIKTIRLNHALELLQSRKYTVTEVSENCGFSSLRYFSTVFKKHFGKSPSEIL